MSRKIKKITASDTQNIALSEIDYIDFSDNRLFKDLCGAHDAYLLLIEKSLGIRLDVKGNRVALTGGDDGKMRARQVLTHLYDQLKSGNSISEAEVHAALRMSSGQIASEGKALDKSITLSLQKRSIGPRSLAQSEYLEALERDELVFGVGPAGTGKTYLAVAYAAHLLLKGDVERIILSRPAIEAGERIGFLPGDMKEKVDPYLRPLYDALYDVMHTDFVDRRIASGDIEIAPLGFMRGRTLSRAVVILDEAQNSTVAQMKMFLTRLGEGSRMVITGDPSQTDLPNFERSGLVDALDLLKGMPGMSVARFSAEDVVRHKLVARIVKAYDERAQRRTKAALKKESENDG